MLSPVDGCEAKAVSPQDNQARAYSVCSLPPCGEGWGGGSLLLHEKCPPTPTPTPNPSPAEVGFTRLRSAKIPNSGKPEFGWGGEHTEFAGRCNRLTTAAAAHCARVPATAPPARKRNRRRANAMAFSFRKVRRMNVAQSAIAEKRTRGTLLSSAQYAALLRPYGLTL